MLFGLLIAFDSFVLTVGVQICSAYEEEKILKKRKARKQDVLHSKTHKAQKKVDEYIQQAEEKAENKKKHLQEQIKSQKKQLQEFEDIRYSLYNEMLLIPYPHQNLFSACYIYRYLITSRTVDMNYIFTQLNLEKILNELRAIASTQREILLVQRQILAENKKQTGLLGAISSNVSGFREDFSSAMQNIRADLGEITDNQRAILDNQATMYRAYLQTAQHQAKSQEETTDYMKMIEQNSRVTAMFKRAEFLGLKFDRNYSGDY